jgi:hypothetical protein
VYALSSALLRADAAREAGGEAWSRVLASRKTDYELVDAVPAHVTHLTNTDLTRTGALFSLHLAALYAVVEKWQEWKFADAAVDRLLRSAHLRTLKQYRHAIFHVDEGDAEKAQLLSANDTIIVWSKEVEDALRAALLDWHENTESRMKEYLLRVGV